MKKKILALFLCVVMVIGILPVYAFAEDTSTTVGEFAQVLMSYIDFSDDDELLTFLIDCEVIDANANLSNELSKTLTTDDLFSVVCKLYTDGTVTGTYACYFIGEMADSWDFITQTQKTALISRFEAFMSSSIIEDPDASVTNATYWKLGTAFMSISGKLLVEFRDFLKNNGFVDFTDPNYNSVINRNLTVTEVAQFLFKANITDNIPASRSLDFIRLILQWEYITSAQSDLLINTYNKLYSSDDFTWKYSVISETDKTAALTGVDVNVNVEDDEHDVVLPETIDGYSMIATADGFDENSTGYWSPRSIYVPDTYKRIGTNFSFGSQWLCYLRLPKNLEYIGFGSFDGCDMLNRGPEFGFEQCMETDANGLRYIGEYCISNKRSSFHDGEERTICVRPGTTLIKGQALSYLRGVKKVILPEGLRIICKGSFVVCDNIKSIVLPSTVTELGEGAIMAAGLQAVYIPATVTSIDDKAFGSWADNWDVKDHLSGLTVYGVSGSAAEEYANKYDDVEFVDVNTMLQGDMDGDGLITANDIGTVTANATGDLELDGNQEVIGDMNHDQVIDGFDISLLDLIFFLLGWYLYP